MFIASIKHPGLPPESGVEFETAREAWTHLLIERILEEDGAWSQDSLTYSDVTRALDARVRNAAWDTMALFGWDGLGTIIGPSVADPATETTYEVTAANSKTGARA